MIRISSFLLLVLAIWVSGCSAAKFVAAGQSTSKPAFDALIGWKIDFKEDPNPTIEKDYEDYIQQLSPEERASIAYRQFFENGKGQHALKIIIGLKGTDWEHILFYSQDNKRIKVITHAIGHSYS